MLRKSHAKATQKPRKSNANLTKQLLPENKKQRNKSNSKATQGSLTKRMATGVQK
jgi:hypothetical protein